MWAWNSYQLPSFTLVCSVSYSIDLMAFLTYFLFNTPPQLFSKNSNPPNWTWMSILEKIFPMLITLRTWVLLPPLTPYDQHLPRYVWPKCPTSTTLAHPTCCLQNDSNPQQRRYNEHELQLIQRKPQICCCYPLKNNDWMLQLGEPAGNCPSHSPSIW